jgi:hypothetical protein
MRKRNFKDPRVPIILLTAGEDEALYFSQMQRDCRYANLQVFQKNPDNRSLIDMIKEAGRLRLDNGNGTAWCIFNPHDIDITPKVLTESRAIAVKKRVALAYSNPGIEFWFHLHFAIPDTPFQSRKDAAEALKKFLPDYRPGPNYLNEKGRDLYMRLFTRKAQAILNANRFNMLFGDRAGLSGPRLDYSCTIPKFLKGVGENCGKCYIAQGQNAAELQNY